jgi:hypothetical protein
MYPYYLAVKWEMGRQILKMNYNRRAFFVLNQYMGSVISISYCLPQICYFFNPLEGFLGYFVIVGYSVCIL